MGQFETTRGGVLGAKLDYEVREKKGSLPKGT
jgi:hypothetical protein